MAKKEMSKFREKLMVTLWPVNRTRTQELMQKLHDQVERDFFKLVDVYKITVQGTHEEIGNAILTQYFTGLIDTEARMAARVHAREKHWGNFIRIFGVPLSKYWENNLLGFNITQFDRDIVKSGDVAMCDAIFARWGEEAAEMIQELVTGAVSQD